MKKFFLNLMPGSTPSNIAKQGDTAIFRERLLQIFLLILAGVDLLIIVASVTLGLRTHPLVTMFIPIFIISAGLVLFRGLPYVLRANVFLFLVFMFSIMSLNQNGVSGAGKLFLLVFTILYSVLMGVRAGIAASVISVVGLLAFGMAVQNGVIQSSSIKELTSTNFNDWVSSASFLLMAVVLTLPAQFFIINQYEKNTIKQRALTAELEIQAASLDQRVQERTRALQRRVAQLYTASTINHAISTELNIDSLIQTAVDLVRDQLNLYYVGIFLMDNDRKYAILRAGSGEAGRNMMLAGHRLQIGGTSMIGQCISARQSRIALDVGAEAVRFNNPNLPLTRSELALPIVSRDHVLGAVTVQSIEPNAFDGDDIRVLQSIADSLATAIDNAELFQQTQENLEEIRSLNRAFVQQEWAESKSSLGMLEYTYEEQNSEPVIDANLVRVPILLRDQEIGIITLETESGTLTQEQQEFIDLVTAQTAIALESARLLSETQRKAQQEEKVNQVSAAIARSVNIDDILRTAVRELSQLPTVAEVSIHLVAAESGANPQPPSNGNGRH